jgi:hypothetical protein
LAEQFTMSLGEAASHPDRLAQVSAAVLLERASVNGWLSEPTTDGGPVLARCDTRAVQRMFFKALEWHLGIAAGALRPRHKCKSTRPPTPSVAYVDLPGVLLAGHGLALHVDTTTNVLQCFFYANSNARDQDDRIGKWCFDDSGINNEVLEEFLKDRVLPEVERRRHISEQALQRIGVA